MVGSGFDSASDGNGWGVNKLRIARNANGTLYVTGTNPGSGEMTRTLQVYQRVSIGSWNMVQSATVGREPGQIAVRGSGTSIALLEQPNGQAMLQSYP